MKRVLTTIVFLMASVIAFGEVKGVGAGQDERNKLVVYDPLQVTKVTTAYGVATTMIFEYGEFYVSHAAGNTLAFEVFPVDNTVSFKPQFYNAVSNVNIFTNRRIYVLEFNSMSQKQAAKSQNLTYSIRYRYSEDQEEKLGAFVEKQLEVEEARKAALACVDTSAMVDPTALNFAYEFAGSADIAPIVAFDDGVFMYLQFSMHASLPVFGVNSDRSEFSVNSRMENGFLVVEQILPELSLRLNDSNVSVRKINPRAHIAKTHNDSKKSGDTGDDW